MASIASNRYTRWFWLLIAGVTIVRLVMALILGPAPQEAYYWNYSKHLALSYYDHPPLTAYLIYTSTSIFGDNRFGIHFAAIFVSLILAIVLFFFIGKTFDKRIAFWSVVLGETTFIFALGGLIITPDGPMLLFWTLTMFALFGAVGSDKISWWIFSGIFMGAAFYSKYPAGLVAIAAFIYLIGNKNRRKLLARPGPYIAAILSMLVFLPVLIWNYRHGWASFVFQSEHRLSESVAFRFDYLLGFIGSQFGVVGIFLLPLFFWGLIRTIKLNSGDNKTALFWWFTVVPLVAFTLVSPFHYVKMNWLAPAYLSGLPLAVFYYMNSKGKFLRSYGKFALIVSLIFTLEIHVLAVVPIIGFGRADTINGWQTLANRVDEIKGEMQKDGPLFICGYEYKTASELRFYLKGQPETLSNSIVGQNGLAYDYWSDPDSLVGKNCIFVYDQRNRYHDPARLADFFERVEAPEVLTVASAGKKITDFFIYQCYRYGEPYGDNDYRSAGD